MTSEMICFRVLEKHKHFVYIIPAILTVICYINGLKGQFVHDDIFAIKNNPDVIGLKPLSDLFKNDFWGMPMTDANSHKSYRPICVLTFRLDYFFSGGSPVWFHVINTTLHVLVTLAFTLVCIRSLQTSLTCTLLASSLFAVHPIHTEAVTGLVGRAEVLAALFFLLSFYTFSRCKLVESDNNKCVENGHKEVAKRTVPTTELRQRYTIYLVISLVLSGAAMLCKETGITVLAVCFLYDLVNNWKTIIRDIFKRQLSHNGSLYIVRCLCILLTGTVLLLFRFWVMNFEQPSIFPAEANPASVSSSLVTRTLTSLYLPTFNFWLLLCPVNLSYDWTGLSIPLVDTFSDARNLISLAFYTMLLLPLVISGDKVWQKGHSQVKSLTIDSTTVTLIMSVGFIVFPFVPASNLFYKVGFVVAERVLYIPSMGYCLLVVQGFQTISARIPQLKPHLLLMYTLMLLVLSLKTIDRNQVWQSRHSLFWSGVRTLPQNGKIHYNLANLLKDEGRLQDAEDHYRIAIKLNPSVASYHLNLGSMLANKTEAHFCYQEALRLRPNHPGAMVNLGSLLLSQGDQSGLSLIRKALSTDPDHFEAVLTMGYVMLARDNLVEAGKYSKQAVQLKPGSSNAHLCYGIYLHNSGQTAAALQEYDLALTLDPQETSALLNSARIHFSDGHFNEARTLLERAVSINRDCSDCLALLGSVYSRQGQGSQAVITLSHASLLAPNNSHTNLKYVQALKDNQQSDKAWRVLKDLMLRFPHNVEVLKFAFTLAMEEKLYSEALVHIHELIMLAEVTRDGTLANLYKEQGDAFRYNNEVENALKSFVKAIQINPSFVEAIIDAGSIYFLQKNYALAEKYYQQALRIDSGNSLAKMNLDKLKRINHKVGDG